MQASLLKNRFNMTKGGTNTTILSVTPTQGGVFSVNVTATSLQQTPHQVTVQITVLDFVLSVQPAPLVFPQGSSASEQVSFTSVNNTPYNVTVIIVKTYITQATASGLEGPSTGISVACTPLKLNLTNSGTGETTSLSNCRVTGNQAGNYTVTVIAASGTVSHATAFQVQVLGPDFTLVSSATVQALSVGTSTTISLTLARQLTLNSNVTLDYSFPGTQPFPPAVTISVQPLLTSTPSVIPLNSTFPTATATVRLTSDPNAPTGIYSLQLRAFSSRYQITHLATITIVITTTTSPHDIAAYSVTANPTSTTVGSTIAISILVQNLGKVNETATVVALVGDLSVAQKNITIAPGTNQTVTLNWNTNGFSPGPYTVGVKVLAVPGETVTNNNILRAPTTVTLNAANSSILQSSYFQTAIIVGLIAVVAIVTILLLQTRRRATGSGDSPPKTSGS
jgi:CARDB